MIKRFLCLVTVLFILAGCSNTSNQPSLPDIEQAKQLVLASEFWERFYSGRYFIQSDDDEAVVENNIAYRKFAVIYDEIPLEELTAVGIDFGEIKDNYKIGTYAEFPFNSIDDMKNKVEQTFTQSYAQENLYDVYDEIYIQNENSVLCSFGISAMFPYTIDISTLTVEYSSEDNANVEISVMCSENYYTNLTGEINNNISICYTAVYENGEWKISDKKIIP